MLANRGELLAKIRLGEDSFLELKEVRLAGGKIRGPAQDDLADELAAFANSAGGVLLLGVEDKAREVVGIPIERLDAVEALLRQACEDSLRPPLAPLIERLTLPDGDGNEQPVLRVEVARSLFVHQSPGGYLHRVGSSKRPMPPDHLARLFQQRSQSRLIRFDETPVMVATLADLDEPLWRRFAPQQAADKAPGLLQKLAMAAEDEQGSLHPTVAGLLMSSRAPQHFLPGAFIQAVAYQGSTVVPAGAGLYQRDAQDIVGPLDRQILSACDFVRKNMRVAARKRPDGGREDRPQFDLLAVFEAVTNAVAHRDYSMAGSKVRLRLFDDRLDLHSPGTLPNTMTPESLPYRQVARNEALTSLLARCPIEDAGLAVHRRHIMDKRGEGVPIILQRSLDLSDRAPEYRMKDEGELMLTIYAAREEDAA
ncbi:ATP-binding protein [Accumulibacter sp.]|jgi:ATP-dependent DNA helicase RecG|nr:ATP-binding protein [Accumulibacter sp.]